MAKKRQINQRQKGASEGPFAQRNLLSAVFVIAILAALSWMILQDIDADEQAAAVQNRADKTTASQNRDDKTASQNREVSGAQKNGADLSAVPGFRAAEKAQNETASQNRVEQTAAQNRDDKTAPQNRHNETAVQNRAEQAAPQNRAESTAPQNRAEQTAAQNREPSAFVGASDQALLAIIIDDVATHKAAEQIAKLNARGLALTPSFMPPKEHSPTPQMAAQFGQDFMLHLPLEALNFAHPEPKTLLASDSCERIKARVDELFGEFKGLKIINNHTGSKFTSSPRAMRCLFSALRAHGGVFIDSRTSANTAAPAVSAEFKQPYIARDVFLDNDANLIARELEHACAVARNKGAAIAIAHPHASTFAALEGFRGCEGVRLVKISQMLRHLRHE